MPNNCEEDESVTTELTVEEIAWDWFKAMLEPEDWEIAGRKIKILTSAAVEAETARCAGVAINESVEYGSRAEGENDPEFSQLMFGEAVAHKIAAAIRAGAEGEKDAFKKLARETVEDSRGILDALEEKE